MNLKEAIEILQADIYNPGSVSQDDVEEAEQLGIEALNYVLKCRVKGYHPVEHALPGETKK